MSDRRNHRRATLLILVSLLALSTTLTLLNVPTVSSQEALIKSKFVEESIPITDPNSPLWSETVVVDVPLSPQVTAKPMNPNPSIRTIAVRSINNGTWVAFLLEWHDSTNNMSTTKTEEFRDAAAIQFSVNATEPYVCMGQAGSYVNIVHWKADWQKDIDTVFKEVEESYPNLWVDYYPHAVGGPPYSIVNTSKTFITGWAVGNPLSDPYRLTPVESLVAKGFGTLTSRPYQTVIGRGVWGNEAWRVVFARPLATPYGSDAQFEPGSRRPIAFAVWDGANREVDGRKSVSSWLVMEIEKPLISGAVMPLPGEVEKPPAPEILPVVGQHAAIVGVWGLIVLVMLLTTWFYDRKKGGQERSIRSDEAHQPDPDRGERHSV